MTVFRPWNSSRIWHLSWKQFILQYIQYIFLKIFPDELKSYAVQNQELGRPTFILGQLVGLQDKHCDPSATLRQNEVDIYQLRNGNAGNIQRIRSDNMPAL
jgi:hypothetical protein